MELDKRYDPSSVEKKWYQYWEENKLFAPCDDDKAETYSIVIPPPNVTGVLHIGHALNNTIQDILVRFERMRGKRTLWVPGTDHAGIATQNVVEKSLHRQNKKRDDYSREDFIKIVWDWKHKHGNTIIKQLKELGCSCDWDRERFTMDEGLSEAVLEAFTRLYDKGLIYQGEYIINWCPRCCTALSDEESEHRSKDGFLYYIKYPLEGSDEFLTVATTRPETMLGDTAVAVNPSDTRYSQYAGKTICLPLTSRKIPIIKDEFVDPEFGTGAVKVTPAHDPNDFDMGKRHGLSFIVVMDEKAVMTPEAGSKYSGIDRFACRKQVIKDLEDRGLFIKKEKHVNSVGHCYRCDTMIEPYMSKQWFVKMEPLAKKAIKVVESGDIKFYPERWTKVYLNWMYNIRDWCISRQIWWGHRIPVWYCCDCGKIVVTKSMPELCPECKSESFRQDEDVLDTWFSSWLWPISTLGWPNDTKDLKTFYPTNTLSTAAEIIFFWVARMIMSGLEFKGKIPFSKVYIHGTVRDETGRKMSKSLGNTIDPLQIIEKYSADALRFSLMMLTAQGQDIYLSEEKFEVGRNFCNKLWNATRFLGMTFPIDESENIEDISDIALQDLTDTNKWILSKLATAMKNITYDLEQFRLNEAAHAIYEFVWHQYCDWYIEMLKIDRDNPQNSRIAFHVLTYALKLMHPIVPFVTEEIWSRIGCKGSIMLAKWPEIVKDEDIIDRDLEAQIDRLQSVIRLIRNIRKEKNIPQGKPISVIIDAAKENLIKFIEKYDQFIKVLAKVDSIKCAVGVEKPDNSISGVLDEMAIYIPMDGLIDVGAEKGRLEKALCQIENELKGTDKKLENKDFIAKAPEKVIKFERDKKKGLLEKQEKIKKDLESLPGSCI